MSDKRRKNLRLACAVLLANFAVLFLVGYSNLLHVARALLVFTVPFLL